MERRSTRPRATLLPTVPIKMPRRDARSSHDWRGAGAEADANGAHDASSSATPFEQVRQQIDAAMAQLRLDLESVVDGSKHKIRWLVTQQSEIADTYKTIICEAIDAVPTEALTNCTVDAAVDYLLNIPILYPRVTTQAYSSNFDVWYHKVDLFVPLSFVLTGESWPVDEERERQWARADGTVSVEDSNHPWSNDDEDASDDDGGDASEDESEDESEDASEDASDESYVHPFHPVAIKKGALFEWMDKMEIELVSRGYRGTVDRRELIWTLTEWKLFTGGDYDIPGVHVPDVDDPDNPDEIAWEKVNLLSRSRRLHKRNKGAHENEIVDELDRVAAQRPEVRAQLEYVNLQYTNDLLYLRSATATASECIEWMHPRKPTGGT
jgi:hypothetical protein